MSEHRKRPTGTHNPSASSLRRWDNEGGAPAGGRAKHPRDTNQLGKSIVDVVPHSNAVAIVKKVKTTGPP